jgi:hypothetical protein
MADNGEYARYQARLQQQRIAADAAARAAARDIGTNPDVKKFNITQAITTGNGTVSADGKSVSGTIPKLPAFNPGNNTVADDGTAMGDTTAIVSPGVGETDDGTAMGDTTNPDDSYGGATQDEQDAITKAQQGTVSGAAGTNSRRPIVPQGNILDRFASYTYRASVYLMNPAQYQQLVRSKKKTIDGYNLLFQSAGAPTNKGGFTGALNANANDSTGGANTINYNAADAGRNPAFPLDFYIDNITIKNLSQGHASGTAHNMTDIKFTVIEPMGITLLDRIYQAVQDNAPKEAGTGKINYTTAQYLMVIRWYGYDIDGNLIKGGPTLSDPNAVIEKFVPMMITKIDWSVSNKLVTYDFSATPIGQNVGVGTRRGAVPYDVQLSGSTVSEILGGGAILPQVSTAATPGAATTGVSSAQAERDDAAAVDAANTSTPPPKANAAKNPSSMVKTGLMGSMNEFVYRLTTGDRPIYQYPDQYEIVFVGAAKQLIGDATIVLPGGKKEAKITPMGLPQTIESGAASPDTDRKDVSMSTFSIVAGQPIVQLIDAVIRNSSYITSQQLTQINPIDNLEEPNPAAANKPVNWYRINFEAIPLKPDNLRNDYSYKIRYIISVYRIDKYDSKYFPVGTFRGVHKSYPWWFTGKNTSVLDYKETLNTAYNMLVSGTNPQNSGSEILRRQIAATMQDMIVYTYGATSGESMQGSKERGNEAAANLADSLYGGADLASSTLRIIGDPAWIQQGSLSSGVTAADLEIGSFLPDGTINFDGEQIFYEVSWNRPDDYDLATGQAAPNGKNKSLGISRVYLATTVTSEFKQGKFEQTISGLLQNLPKRNGTNKAPGASLPAAQVDRANEQRRLGVIAAAARRDGTISTTGYSSKVTTPADEQRRLSFLADVARREGASSSSLTATPQVNANPSNNSPQSLNSATPGPKDTVVPALPPQPATSGSGENLDVGDPFVPPGTLSGRITADGLGNSPSVPQDMVRDY